MTKRRTDNTMTKRRKTDNTMTKRQRTDNTMTKRRTDNTMTKRKGAKGQTKETQHRKLKIDQHKCTKKPEGELGCSERVRIFFSTSGIRRISIVTNPVISHV
jgi:hypothetical protein